MMESDTLVRSFIGLGSNMGDRRRLIEQALEQIDVHEGVFVRRISTLIETPAVGPAPQPDYLNAAAELETTLPPRALLDLFLSIERDLDRVRDGQQWAPRTIDIDLLLYGTQIIREAGLIVPHPRLHRRRFVLEPLVELRPEAFHPVLKATAVELLAQLED